MSSLTFIEHSSSVCGRMIRVAGFQCDSNLFRYFIQLIRDGILCHTYSRLTPLGE